MNILNQILTDIWQHLTTTINFTIVILVIASGYLLGRNHITRAILPLSKTYRVAIVSLFVTALYAYFVKIDVGVYLASYFVAFGFHTIAIKWIEKRTTNPEIRPPHK